MKQFEVYGRIHKDLTDTIFADTAEEAVRIFKRKHPDYKPETVGNNEIIGYCENSGKAIFEGDDYEEDNDGIMWLKSELN